MGEQWPIYLEGMERCYLLEPLVKQVLSHCVNLGLAFLQALSLKMKCTEEEVLLMPIRDRLISRARLSDGVYQDFKKRQSGEVLHASQGQEISPQV